MPVGSCEAADRAMQAGYAFISADYTLLAPSTGHDVLEDIKDVFRYLEKEVNKDFASAGSGATVDAASIIVSGSSAGGMCAYLAACHASPKPRGVLSLYGQGGDFLVIAILPVLLDAVSLLIHLSSSYSLLNTCQSKPSRSS